MTSGDDRPTCRDCARFVDDPRALERELPGLLILSSASGCSRGTAGICRERDRFQVPEEACEVFCRRS